jgi:hypothetical protein
VEVWKNLTVYAVVTDAACEPLPLHYDLVSP